MKKFILLLSVLFCTILGINAQDIIICDSTAICHGGSHAWFIDDATSNSVNVISYNGIYDTIFGNPIILSPDSTTRYTLISTDGHQPSIWVIYTCIITVNTPPTFTVDSIHSPTCPYPYLGPGSPDSPNSGPWADGSFSVILDDSVQNYTWIRVDSDSSFFFTREFHDSFTIGGLRGGTYNIVARGTNGCEVTQQVTIQQPPAWEIDNEIWTDIYCNKPGTITFECNGGTEPYVYTWRYNTAEYLGDSINDFSDTNSISVYQPGSYFLWVYDAHRCMFQNLSSIGFPIYQVDTDRVYLTYYETVPIGDTAELINAPDSITFCRANDYFFNAMSLGHGCEDCDTIYSWSDNFYGREEAQNHDPVSVSGWLTVHFTDQNGCPSADSIYIDIYIPEFNILGISDSMFNDSTYTIIVSPAGGNLIFNGVEILLDSNGNGLIDLNGLNPGTYQIDYSGEFGPLSCFDEHSWTFEVQQKVGIDDYSNSMFSVHPNPCHDKLFINSDLYDAIIEIYSISGQKLFVHKLNEHSIDVSELSSGIYLLKVISKDTLFTKKFVKK